MPIEPKFITDYIEFLTAQGFTITLHGKMVRGRELMKFNFHQNPYCHFVKSVYGKWEQCIRRHSKVFKKCENGSFFGCCYAGVGEYIYPVKKEDNVTGFISVSGFLCEESISKAIHFAKKNDINTESLTEMAKKYLSESIPEKEYVDSAIRPLVFMLEEHEKNTPSHLDGETELCYKILKYITENCHSKITMSDLSRKYNYSVSALSHMFSKKFGKSLPAYIDELRMSEAKWYLLHSDMSITEIAMFLGYSSSQYFTMCFKKRFGVTPKECRATKI